MPRKQRRRKVAGGMPSERRRRTAADAPFFVYTPGVAVPRRVIRLLVAPSVEVLPEREFEGLKHLKEVVLSEGLREIGRSAFEGCRALKLVSFPSTLLEIGYEAFRECTSLTRLHFLEGLIKIGDFAFCGCDSLKKVMLVNGIQKIGSYAFELCALKHIIIPATLTEIDWFAFGECRLLETVKLSGRIHWIEEEAFAGCEFHDHFTVTAKCLVVKQFRENCNFSFVTNGTIPYDEDIRVVITSECFYSISSAEVSALEIAMAEILRTQLEWDDKRERLLGVLAPHELRRKKEVAGILELCLWKAEMHRSGETGPGVRDQCRRKCGAGVVIQNVLPFL